MSTETLTNNPEKREGSSDNDRKFVVEAINSEFLAAHDANSYYMVTDWSETNEHDETKLVKKLYDDGKEEFFHIAKVGVEQDRESKKTPLSEVKYNEYLERQDSSKPHVEKRRYEFKFIQNGIQFIAKYDEFADSTLRVLEIDTKSKSDEDRKKFDPSIFDFALVEVTGIKQFYGHRIASLIHVPTDATNTLH